MEDGCGGEGRGVVVAVTSPKEEAEEADLAEEGGGDERPEGCSGGRGSILSPTSTSSKSTATVFVAWPRLVRRRAFIGADAGGQRRRLGARAARRRQ